MRHPDETRLQLRWQSAEKDLKETIEQYNQIYVDAAKDRTQYFEKLTIGCGAAIAALVSFLGAMSDKHPLHPKWMLPTIVAVLTLAMLAALWRNWRYQNYLVAAVKKAWLESARFEQQCRNELFQAVPVPTWQTGKRLDLKEWYKRFATVDDDLEKTLAKLEKEDKHRLVELAVASGTCLVSIGIAMVALVVMAFLNFMN